MTTTAADRLAIAKRRAGLTDRQLATAGSVSRATLQRLRSGQARQLRLETLERISGALGCSAAWLAFGLDASVLAPAAGEAVVVRVSLPDCSSAELAAWVDELRRAFPERPVIVLLGAELEMMPAGRAKALRRRQERALGLQDAPAPSNP